MRDVDHAPDEDMPDVSPDDPEEQALYIQKFRGRYAEEIVGRDPVQLEAQIRAALQWCPPLVVRHPRDVLRFLRLVILELPRLRRSPFLDRVVHRVMTATDDWSATKRLDFLDLHVVGRSLPDPEPDFGPWWPDDRLRLDP